MYILLNEHRSNSRVFINTGSLSKMCIEHILGQSIAQNCDKDDSDVLPRIKPCSWFNFSSGNSLASALDSFANTALAPLSW